MQVADLASLPLAVFRQLLMIELHFTIGGECGGEVVLTLVLHKNAPFVFLQNSADITKASTPEGLLAYA